MSRRKKKKKFATTAATTAAVTPKVFKLEEFLCFLRSRQKRTWTKPVWPNDMRRTKLLKKVP